MNPKKVAVVGSRGFEDKNLLYKELNALRKVMPFECIVSGGARGADKLAEEYADEFKIPKKIFLADWTDMSFPCWERINLTTGERYNALAGKKRNDLIVKEADIVVAFWDGLSRGTEDTIEKTRKEGKKLIIVKIK
jgi:hypothetical protein